MGELERDADGNANSEQLVIEEAENVRAPEPDQPAHIGAHFPCANTRVTLPSRSQGPRVFASRTAESHYRAAALIAELSKSNNLFLANK
jgi:hypothetical protein